MPITAEVDDAPTPGLRVVGTPDQAYAVGIGLRPVYSEPARVDVIAVLADACDRLVDSMVVSA